jgi:hypothetical protein
VMLNPPPGSPLLLRASHSNGVRAAPRLMDSLSVVRPAEATFTLRACSTCCRPR